MTRKSQDDRDTDDRYIAPPAQRAVRLLRAIVEGDAVVNASVTAKALGINRTTLIRLLHTLASERFIERRTYGEGWQPGVGFLGLAARALFSQDLVRVALPVLTALSDAFRLSAHLGVLDGRDVLYLLRRAPDLHVVSNVRVGCRLPAHATTMGRMLLAHLPVEALRALYARGALEAYTDKTATTLPRLVAQLDVDRAAGLAFSESNFEIGIDSVAAAVFDHSGAAIAAINLTGPAGLFPDGKAARVRLGAAVRQAAAEISARLGHVTPDVGAGPATAGTRIASELITTATAGRLAKSAPAPQDRAMTLRTRSPAAAQARSRAEPGSMPTSKPRSKPRSRLGSKPASRAKKSPRV
ncbi:IclR family transcriptional regulator [Rhodoplanes roseus]|uniref:IclR family transcriptional regulator n=1 Tax=Rhodoplanes roseus TaxID=29409 RepID=A0A327L0A3_9BRAD|nr:IclR family transcriptional regulator [Rhodoplanes roseus]RAI43817.1 hypothetical protein CH341_12325 [Rhodoplanes roseus]